MSEKGTLSKSIASNISEAIIDKLGGAGYAPTEWSKNINLLGIASADIEEALASITEDASTSEKGGLSLSIASDVGTMLNKKYNTSRGFKPSEVSSAVSMLSPLPEKTASGAIADFSDGADDVPTKSLIVTIPPTLSGVSSVTETQTGRNLLDPTKKTEATSTIWRFYLTDGLLLRKGTYTISASATMNGIYVRKKADNTDVAVSYNQSYLTFTLTDDLLVVFTYSNVNSWDGVTFQLEVGNQQTAHVPYTTPTQYTASLGRTIYGGQVDIVNGVGTADCSVPIALNSLTWTKTTIGGHDCFFANLPNGYIGSGSSYVDGVCDDYAITTDGNMGTDKTIRFYFNSSFNFSRVSIRDDQYASYTGAQFKEAVTGNIVYQLAESAQTDFTFTGQEIPTRLGYNAFWSDSGDTEVTYRADLDLYEAPSMLLEANNTETEGNEEQEENE